MDKHENIKRNLVHANHVVMTLNAINIQINFFTTIVRLVVHVILIIKCSHICDYYNHICDYSVDIIE
jgi:hypothetical protein